MEPLTMLSPEHCNSSVCRKSVWNTLASREYLVMFERVHPLIPYPVFGKPCGHRQWEPCWFWVHCTAGAISWKVQAYCINSYSASRDNWCTVALWNRIMTAQCEGMGEVGSARYEPALLPPCPSIRVLSYSNCQRSSHAMSQWMFRNLAL